MALRTPPSWLQNGSHPAENDRLTTQAMYATTGIIGASSLAVTANSPAGMSVRVATGWAAIVGTIQANMGTYVAYNDATNVLTITTADPSNPRIDRVVVTVQDSYYSGSADDVIFQVIAGTPAASPVAPATPANSISLATIAVSAGATQINAGNITDTRVQVTTNLPVGDITDVNAGQGLSGGGSSGSVTVALDYRAANTVTFNAQTGTTYTLALTDSDLKLVTLSNASPITVTVPTNAAVAFPIGAQVNIQQIGAGQVSVVGAGGVTINATASNLRAQWSAATLVKSATNTWTMIGDLA